ncbi:hypothetical protein CEXT_312211 [Caerostris extrusa]|uniref:Uncharacterized protein n=1 Tax=Caerostris extrusa TaxID=172846 RepID=A0AAV4TAZ9_CAEEX|nr:hypothetical protein CEXT_312211 [Caerostris extrusa]
MEVECDNKVAIKSELVDIKPIGKPEISRDVKEVVEDGFSANSIKNEPISVKEEPPIFKPDELRQALMPTLEKLYKQDPESLPFRRPVDPTMLMIPVNMNFFTFKDLLLNRILNYNI